MVRVEASATIANFGPGYDTFGMCLESPTDVLEIESVEKPGITMDVIREGHFVPNDSRRNTASVAARELLRIAEISAEAIGLKMKLLKGIRPGSGLGSSAASAVAGAFGAAALMDIKDYRKILMAASQGEGVSSGAPHLDNVAPSLYGGFTVVLDQDKFKVLRITPPEMRIIVCLPELTVKTARARNLIPDSLPVSTTISHVGWASGMVHGITKGDIRLMASCMRDEISIPARKELIKGYELARSAAMASGALSFSISGSGPAVFSLSEENHEAIGEAMVEGFGRANVKSSYFLSKPGTGARITDKS